MAAAQPVRVVKSAARDVRVKVVVRVRPFLPHETDERCVSIQDDQSIEIEREGQCVQYRYKILTQEESHKADSTLAMARASLRLSCIATRSRRW